MNTANNNFIEIKYSPFVSKHGSFFMGQNEQCSIRSQRVKNKDTKTTQPTNQYEYTTRCPNEVISPQSNTHSQSWEDKTNSHVTQIANFFFNTSHQCVYISICWLYGKGTNVDLGHIKTYVYSVKYNFMVDCIQYYIHIQVDNIIWRSGNNVLVWGLVFHKTKPNYSHFDICNWRVWIWVNYLKLFQVKWAIIQLHHDDDENNMQSVTCWWCLLCSRPIHWALILRVLAH